MKFCQRCYDDITARWAKRAKYDPKCKLDVKRMIFPCQVPVHTSDYVGNPMVRIWNCKTKRFALYTLKDYNDKKIRGEL